jgi:hypothetical protein
MDRNSYKSRKTLSILLTLLASFGVTQGIAAADPEELEPCINGGVSETGVYVSQAQEDKANRKALLNNTQVKHEFNLAPCINGGVSATGMHINQATEDEMTQPQYINVGELAR